MAAAGTGLPGAGGAAISTSVDTRSYGAAEQATADGFALAARGFDRLTETLRPAANVEAQTLAEQKAAAGQFEQRLTLTSMDAAFNQAMRTGTMARLGLQRDADLDKLRVEHAFDPDGYNAAATEYRTSALKAAVPGALAIDWGMEFDERSNRNLSTIRSARAERDLGEAKDNLTAQTTRIVEETVSEFAGLPPDQAWQDAGVQANLVRAMSNIDALEANPAFGVSTEEAATMRLEVIGKVKAGAARSFAIQVLRTDGAPAAMTAIQQMMTAEDGFSSQRERDMVVSAARAAVTEEVSLENQRINQVNSERSAREQEGARRIEEDIAKFALTGEGSGLTEDEVRAYGGDDYVLRWRKGMADAVDQRELFENLPADSEEAAIEIARRASQQGFETLPMITDAGDLDSVINAMSQVETPGASNLISQDPDGAGPAGGGAYGDMQVLPDTARRIAAKLGLPYDQNRLLNDVAYNRAIGREYMSELTTRYRGDVFLAITAYHAGEGNVDGWLRSVGDPRSGAISREAWLDGIESRGNPRSAAYPRKVLAAMNGGRAAAAWDQHREQRAGVLADPATSVQGQPDVRAAFALMGEARNGRADLAEAGETLVTTYLAAQERTGVPAARRRALPMRELVSWAGYLARNEADPLAFQAATDVITETFGEKGGERVIRDALIVRGNTEFAAEVAAAATRAARAGGPPPSPVTVAAARRGEAVSRAASGSADVSSLSDDDLRRAAGL
jgi:soluble lytic murein transglycosylase